MPSRLQRRRLGRVRWWESDLSSSVSKQGEASDRPKAARSAGFFVPGADSHCQMTISIRPLFFIDVIRRDRTFLSTANGVDPFPVDLRLLPVSTPSRVPLVHPLAGQAVGRRDASIGRKMSMIRGGSNSAFAGATPA